MFASSLSACPRFPIQTYISILSCNLRCSSRNRYLIDFFAATALSVSSSGISLWTVSRLWAFQFLMRTPGALQSSAEGFELHQLASSQSPRLLHSSPLSFSGPSPWTLHDRTGRHRMIKGYRHEGVLRGSV
jgi:hypothetical protein